MCIRMDKYTNIQIAEFRCKQNEVYLPAAMFD